MAALRAAAEAHLSPAGQLQVATALEVTAALEARLHALRHQLPAAARHLAGAKVLAARLYGAGPVTSLPDRRKAYGSSPLVKFLHTQRRRPRIRAPPKSVREHTCGHRRMQARRIGRRPPRTD